MKTRSNEKERRDILEDLSQYIESDLLRARVEDAVNRAYWIGFDDGYIERDMTGWQGRFDQ